MLGGNQFYGSKKNITEYYNAIADDIYDFQENPSMVFNLWLKQTNGYQLDQKSKKLISELEEEHGYKRKIRNGKRWKYDEQTNEYV